MTADFSSFTDRFDKVVDRSPDSAAVMTDGIASLSYKDLQRRAQSIAAALPDVKQGSIIALFIEKSADYLAAVIACWYRGYAFLPLDTELPQPRIDYILQDAKPAAVLTRGRSFPGYASIHLDTVQTAAYKAAALSPAMTAYVIYTSGSTGTPKGVIVPHRGLVAVLDAQVKLFNLNGNSRSLFFLSTSFDASVSDFGTAFLAGACLCIETGGKLMTAAAIADIVPKRKITYIDIPPSLLRVLEPEKMPACLDTLTIGGEICPPAVVRHWARHMRIVNVYGPTEATICTSAVVCDKDEWQKPLIGNPLPGVDYYIFDAAGNPADDGELYIGGDHLADGYLNQPSMTAAKFIMKNGKRLYRTGDHVIRDENGGVEFIGRMDRQVKWRGQLIELEEIEKTMLLHPNVARAAALKISADGRETLAGFAERKPDCPLSADELAALLSRHLPAWMVPQSFTILDRLPLTVTGKVNFSALARFSPDEGEYDDPPFIPASPHEEKLLQCWQRVLKKKDIPATKNFISLGGDSFAVLQLMLEGELAGFAMTPDFIHKHPSIKAQARALFSTSSANTYKKTAQEIKETLKESAENTLLSAKAAPRQMDKYPQKNIFMIGATGFLGGRILSYLLEYTDAHVHLLVRGSAPDAALRRLKLDAKWQDRTSIYIGDAGMSRFGLDDQTWQKIADEADTIINTAALVNMLLPYESLYNANTASVQQMIELASHGRPKKIHHASTLSVFVSTDRNHGQALETDDLEKTKDIYGGYTQSKWAAEYLLHDIKKHIDLSIYRFGLVTPDSMTGASSSHDFLKVFMEGVIALGHVPDGPHDEIFVDVTPIDYAADIFGRLILADKNATYHIANKKGFSFAQILRRLAAHGHDIKTLPQNEWQDFIDRKRQQKPLTPVESVSIMAMCRCLPADMFETYRAIDLFQGTGITFDMTHVKNDLGEGYIEPPAADDALLDLYIKSL